MPDPTDRPPFGGHEPPPPPPALVPAGIALVLAIITLVLLLLGRFNPATIFAGLTVLATAATFVMTLRSSKSSDRPPGGPHVPPPPR